MPPVPVTRTSWRFAPDPSRVIAKPFVPSGDLSGDGHSRVTRILSRILALSDAEVTATLRTIQARFAARHRNLPAILEAHLASVKAHLPDTGTLSADRQQLIGAYFTQEYSIEAAALTNPSMVLAPDQDGLGPGEQRFVLSLRAIGEGHISSIQFRSGVIDANGEIAVDPPSRHASTAHHRAPVYEKPMFRAKLAELGADDGLSATVLDELADRFTLEELETVIRRVDRDRGHARGAEQVTRTIHWLASSNYDSAFTPETALSERTLFPTGPAESRGMEDARFVRFTDDDGVATYFAPYTAYDGFRILPQLIETPDFVSFHIATLNGPLARNKGIALFPRRIGGRYAALSRVDNERNFLMWSDNVRFWHQGAILQTPEFPWEVTQIGNAGSPLETDAGWLVITHGVGALRQYALGAILLDRDDPSRVIGRLRAPLLEPADDERDGYVPNVVYSCGSLISGRFLVLPYGVSDVATRIATVRLDDLLTELTAGR